MNILMSLGGTASTLLLAAEEAQSGGLFDFGGTLILQIVQFLLLMTLLNLFFFRPIQRVVDERSEYIRSNASNAQRRLDEAKALADQYEQELRSTRQQAQKVIAEAEAEAQKIRSQQVAEAQAEAQKKTEAAAAELEAQKRAALANLSGQVETISRSLTEKLLGAARSGGYSQ